MSNETIRFFHPGSEDRYGCRHPASRKRYFRRNPDPFENHCRKNVLDRAAQVFADLKMHKTALRNGVLIYVALEDKQLAILGDAGINAKVPDHFWDDIKNNMIEKFKSGQICEGVCEAVLTAGQQLKAFFPYQADDVNELSDDISFKN